MTDFKKGFEFAVQQGLAGKAGAVGAHYERDIENAVAALEESINGFAGDSSKKANLAGKVAEHWHSGTFNIDAVVKGSIDRAAKRGGSDPDGLASADVVLSSGGRYQLKYCQDAETSAAEQAKSFFERYKEYLRKSKKNISYEEYIEQNKESLLQEGLFDAAKENPHAPMYSNQQRIVSADQLDGAKEAVRRKAITEEANRPEQVGRYRDTEQKLTDRIQNDEGVESRAASKEEMYDKAEQGRKGEYEYDKEIADILRENAAYVLDKSLQAGRDAAVVAIVLKLAPEVLKAVQHLMKEGELDPEELKRGGMETISTGATAFINGSVSAFLTIACKGEMFGAAMKSIDPHMIGAVTVLAVNTAKNALAAAAGRITKADVIENMARDVIVSSCSIGIGTAAAVLLPELNGIAYMLGSLVGSFMGSVIYSQAYSKMMAFCVESGCTFFGLVEQDYTLPETAWNELGIQTFEVEMMELDEFSFDEMALDEFQIEVFDFDTIEFVIMRRGLVSMRKVGFSLV